MTKSQNNWRRKRPTRDEELAELATQIRTLFIMERRQLESMLSGEPSYWLPGSHWDGGVNARGYDRDNIWLALAKRCREYGLDPVRFVKQVFVLSSTAPKFHLPRPSDLDTPAVLEQYAESSLELSEVIRISLITNGDLLQQTRTMRKCGAPEMTDAALFEEILADDSIEELTALFRYCMAVQFGFREVAAKYRELALRQYRLYPELYRVLWAKILPAGFPANRPAAKKGVRQ